MSRWGLGQVSPDQQALHTGNGLSFQILPNPSPLALFEHLLARSWESERLGFYRYSLRHLAGFEHGDFGFETGEPRFDRGSPIVFRWGVGGRGRGSGDGGAVRAGG
jgi:hypothetical protein